MRHGGASWHRPAGAGTELLLAETQRIVILRDPVRRAWSHSWNEVGKRRELSSLPPLPRRERELTQGRRANPVLPRRRKRWPRPLARTYPQQGLLWLFKVVN